MTNIPSYLQPYAAQLGVVLDPASCAFSQQEIDELESTDELLVYLPSSISPQQLCEALDLRSNICFQHERLIRTVMVHENQWFVASAKGSPELLYESATSAKRIYENEGLHGMDLRRYLAFVGVFRAKYSLLPDQNYWSFLLSASYDRSGVSIIGFDSHGILNHHGWMKNFRAKFVGSRYIVLPPRIEISPDTEMLSRAYRGRFGSDNLESAIDE